MKKILLICTLLALLTGCTAPKVYNKFQDIIFTKATGMMFLRNRIKFFRPDGTRGDSPGCGSVLIAFGRENAEILRNSSLQGKYVELNNDK